MVVGGSQQETLDPGFVLFGTRQQGVPVILRELVLPGGFDLVSPSFTMVGKNNPDPSGGINQEEALEVDGTYIEEITQLHHKTSPHMEPSRPKEVRQTKEHITPGNGNRHEKNEQELYGIRKERFRTEWVGKCGSAAYAPLRVTGVNSYEFRPKISELFINKNRATVSYDVSLNTRISIDKCRDFFNNVLKNHDTLSIKYECHYQIPRTILRYKQMNGAAI
ncbi:unnamed protein product [Schistosoma margrebowiei]|uniref:Uncharacterized protein n=1 Tax=Schistosoma margrebowiei TaxID=48269 RepID=A0A183M0L3_9TREM|nr:unnamed protein product [Schistosoma margrebowiei]